MTRPVVALHAPGDEAAGGPWRSALGAAPWAAAVLAPDMPGHGETPTRPGGDLTLGSALLHLLEQLRDFDASEPPVVIGAGGHGWIAHVLALAGRAAALVVVDGLGGPWLTPAEQIRVGCDSLRAIADDPEALAPAPARGLDPRLRHVVFNHSSRRMAWRAAEAMPVPALIIESAQSPMTGADVDELAAAYAAGATVLRVGSADADTVVRLAGEWLEDSSSPERGDLEAAGRG